MTEGLDIIARKAERQAAVKVLDRDYIDLTSTIGKGILAFLSTLAQRRARTDHKARGGRAPGSGQERCEVDRRRLGRVEGYDLAGAGLWTAGVMMAQRSYSRCPSGSCLRSTAVLRTGTNSAPQVAVA